MVYEPPEQPEPRVSARSQLRDDLSIRYLNKGVIIREGVRLQMGQTYVPSLPMAVHIQLPRFSSV